MLFGRRKPGFTEELHKVTGAAGDTAGGESERETSERLAQAETPEEAAPETETDGSGKAKPELTAYLASLPDAETAELEEAQKISEEAPETPAQELADYIRQRTQGAQVTSLQSILKEVPDAERRLKEMKEDPSCSDIVSRQGEKDEYFYSHDSMSDNYAMIAVLVDERNLPETIAQMVRFNCRTYPAPTPYTYFERNPYNYTLPQIERAVHLIEEREEYKDIHAFYNRERVPYLYSDREMSDRYARALADPEEFTD